MRVAKTSFVKGGRMKRQFAERQGASGGREMCSGGNTGAWQHQVQTPTAAPGAMFVLLTHRRLTIL